MSPLYEVVSRVVRFIKTERGVVVARGWGGELEQLVFNGTEFQGGVMKKFWKWIVVMAA